MKYLFMLLLPAMAWAGQAEYMRDVENENAYFHYALKTCKRLPTKVDVAQCEKDVRKRHQEVLAGLKKHHLSK